MSTMDAYTTAGLIFDPFTIHAAGLARRHGVAIRNAKKNGNPVDVDRMFEPLHGEAKFKQAFANACHFAERMTVTGPVATLSWDAAPEVARNALLWPIELGSGSSSLANQDIFERFSSFIAACTPQSSRLPHGMYRDDGTGFLHTMPDLTTTASAFYNELGGIEPFDATDATYMNSWSLSRFMYGHTNLGCKLFNTKVKELITGLPTLALMAVTFSFKKVSNAFPSQELTNLSNWPPVTFLIPALIPAGAQVDPNGATYHLGEKLCSTQPTIYSFTIQMDHLKRLVPFGQPFAHASVDKEGKCPDELRSLSDVFRNLWSPATAYSSWNFGMPLDMSTPLSEQINADMYLEPMGAGRRIRGYNRFHGIYSLKNLEVLSLTSDFKDTVINRGQTAPRIYGRAGRKHIVVLPSYLGKDGTDKFHPVIHALGQYLNTASGLEVFLSKNGAGTLNPLVVAGSHNHKERLYATDPEMGFIDAMAEANQLPDPDNPAPIPVGRVVSNVSFEPTGDPNVFGLNFSSDALIAQCNAVKESPTEAMAKGIVDETSPVTGFKFMEAFCSSSTKELTEVFKEQKKTSKKAKKQLTNNDEVINLFDEIQDAMFLGVFRR